MNPLYPAYMSNPANRPAVYATPMQNMNPMQQMNQVMQAMQNPIQVVMQAFPDIPAYMQNDADQIMQYLQQTRHISNEQIQGLKNRIFPRF